MSYFPDAAKPSHSVHHGQDGSLWFLRAALQALHSIKLPTTRCAGNSRLPQFPALSTDQKGLQDFVSLCWNMQLPWGTAHTVLLLITPLHAHQAERDAVKYGILSSCPQQTDSVHQKAVLLFLNCEPPWQQFFYKCKRHKS